MGKLSHIEDVEKRNADERVQQRAPEAVSETPDQQVPTDKSFSSEQEEEFHGLDSSQPMGAGHKALLILAVAVVIIAILYISNCYVHFI